MTEFLFSVFFGSIGVGYFIYGKKQQNAIAGFAGIGLCAFPYLVSDPYLMALIGTLLILLPWFVRG
ncbi:MAG: hypothetical protein COV66_03295 [Nitrospinae bacterium CG11_big_fil_rev_8_21_14_0_20_45_15]|nr:MAG: hypothetical protein COV66_03295 [Nitrospinae bacterium CG11_big_fil_rev_8_21_14_0_20_45_15]